MNQRELTERSLALCPGSQHVEADGGTFFFCSKDRQISFATLVTKDEYDSASDLDREGVYRLNIGVGRDTYTRLFGPPPPHPSEWGVVETGHDYHQLDCLMPHPMYSPMSWVCVLNPGEETFETIKPLIVEAYEKTLPQAEARLAKQTRGTKSKLRSGA
ncbi:MAG TPA: DUF6194 family protein [Rhodothermales bacterium]|nr:DUF6194 family protein [Rhodothermales bacterium]